MSLLLRDEIKEEARAKSTGPGRRSPSQAETEISMFSRECLGKDRIATPITLAKRAAAWVRWMNEERRTINWGFTREKARAKFKYQPRR